MIQKRTAQGTGAISATFDPRSQGGAALLAVLVSFNTAPSTSENMQVIYDSADGSDYDTVIVAEDPAAAPAVRNLVDKPLALARGDRIRVTYTNTDARTVSVTALFDDDYYAR